MTELEFREFYRTSRDPCLRAVLACVGDRPTAEDLVAEAFTRAWISWHKVSQHPAPRAWIVRTALNTRISWWRRRGREQPVGTIPDMVATDTDQSGLDPALLVILRGLPQRQREVIALRVFLDLDTRSTAQALGIAEGTVTAHLARAIAALRAQLVPTDEPEALP